MTDQTLSKPTLGSLWRQFLPLSLSDVTMACGDPLITTTLAHMPAARLSLGALGVAKAIAVFFESPIIMLLHASNTLAPAEASRKALWRFMLLACGTLTTLLAILASPPVFSAVSSRIMGVSGELAENARLVLLLMFLWPAAIGWRRYFQGLLIRGGHSAAVGRAGIIRLIVVSLILASTFWISIPGITLAGVALMTGVLAEAIAVTLSAMRLGVTNPTPKPVIHGLPTSLSGVWRFYWPLANSMMVVWGGRVLLIALIARAIDAPLALAAWPAAWGLILVVANSTRMVQQVIIRNRHEASQGLLLSFACSVGLSCTLILLIVALTPIGQTVVEAFIGKDAELARAVSPVILLCAAVPLLISVQNAIQGLLIGDGKTARINGATWIGTALLLSSTFLAVKTGIAGATAAALGMTVALAFEVAWLAIGVSWVFLQKSSVTASSESLVPRKEATL